MSLILDWLPIFAFFIAYKFSGIYLATAIMIALSILQVIASYIQGKPIFLSQWINLTLVSLMGGATLFFKNMWFIKWKPTIFYWLLGLACVVSTYFAKMPVAQYFLGKIVVLPAQSWRVLNRYWAFFFIGLGVLNLVVAYTTKTETWVYFKLFGLLSLTLLFMIIQLIYLSRFDKHEHTS